MTTAAHPIGIIGSGTMGAGIAQVAAASGWAVRLCDLHREAVDDALDRVRRRLSRAVELGHSTRSEADQTLSRLTAAADIKELDSCDLIIESVSEEPHTKATILAEAAAVAPASILASCTSSLSISQLGATSGAGERLVGMHFFNPAPVMPLVEVVRGADTSEEALQRATLLAEAWGKTVVHASDTAGFIVSRIARPYYLESWRILEDGLATVSEIDAAMQSLGEFRMGAFELMDLIGQDVNLATTRSICDRLGSPPRLHPCDMQTQVVERGHLGRKTGCGAYAHDDRESLVPAILVDRHELEISDRLRAAMNQFCLAATSHGGDEKARYIFSRILAAIITEAGWAMADGIASAEDIDTAMRLGMNYPKGPVEWAEEIGEDTVLELLAALNETVDDGRFVPPPLPVGAEQ